ncbi:MAG: hypothetical protein IKL84_04310 [Clostridia bacterium]|nr:hypothetical protein [Clostridia bacterium]
MHDKRSHRIHVAASTLPPLTILVSLSYTIMYHPLDVWGRYMTPLLAIVLFIVGYGIQLLQEKLFHYERVDHDIDDGVELSGKRYIRKRFLLIPAAIALIPGIIAVPICNDLILRLVENGTIDYYSDNFIAPYVVMAVIVIGAVLGASARMQPANLSISSNSVWFYVIAHCALFVIDLFMEIPSILPCVALVVVIITAMYELNLSFVEDLCRKVRDTDGLERLRETNYQHVHRIYKRFMSIFIVPFLLTAAASVVWQYLLENALNKPL